MKDPIQIFESGETDSLTRAVEICQNNLWNLCGDFADIIDALLDGAPFDELMREYAASVLRRWRE